MKNKNDTPTMKLSGEESDILEQFLAISTDGRIAGAAIEHALLTSLAFALRRTARGC